MDQLTPQQREEAQAVAAAAQRAEERAEQRALEKALRQKEVERRLQEARFASKNKPAVTTAITTNGNGLVFVPKRKRGQVQNEQEAATSSTHHDQSKKPAAAATQPQQTATAAPAISMLSESERKAIKETYLGRSREEQEEIELRKRKKPMNNKKITFRFRWDETDDTYNEEDPLYAPMVVHHSKQQQNMRDGKFKKLIAEEANFKTVSNKPLNQMTTRDWRIFRENYNISVKGGQAPPPMRSFRESPSPHIPELNPALLDAIKNVLKYKEPSPIQRQAIPIGLQRRDLIGIAETGSGKTIAFGVPLCHYLLSLPLSILQRVDHDGPLALIMAPTRELALQIEVEISKLLSRQRIVRSYAVVGGQNIQTQAQEIRRGIHILVGTPGRINDCIEMSYLVLTQCSYIIMDEADRMIDMGFAPQMESILAAMGGTLKSENESEAYQQELEDLKQSGVARHRITAMFSATIPSEVESIARRYLRHPAIISIGDKDSSKNARIEQRLIWLSTPAKKEDALRNLLRDPRFVREKIIVFVNEKKHADGVGRMVERAGRQCVVMHGGKSQDQREANLELFRRGGVVMVATDVAGRGLDIPDVAHVINFDLPTRSIENYTHRIGRTGRAGKQGLATSLITDEDENIMADLKAYLQSTGSAVPERLAKHKAAQSAADSGNIIY